MKRVYPVIWTETNRKVNKALNHQLTNKGVYVILQGQCEYVKKEIYFQKYILSTNGQKTSMVYTIDDSKQSIFTVFSFFNIYKK